MTYIYAIANQKGGVGKTTTAVNLSAYLATMGKRVLLIDMDAQANASSSLGVEKEKVTISSYDILLGNVTAAKATLKNAKLNLYIIPSAPALAAAEVELVGELAREYRLRQALATEIEKYDYIFMDCPPSLGLLTVNALTAATNGVLIPVQCEYLALEGPVAIGSHRATGETTPEPATGNRWTGADHVRRTHRPGAPGGRRSGKVFWFARLQHAHSAQRAPERSAQLWATHSDLRPQLARQPRLSGAGGGVNITQRRDGYSCLKQLDLDADWRR